VSLLLTGRNDGQSSQSLCDTASRCAGSKGNAWFVRGLRGARLAALAAALRRQSVKGGKGTATPGGNRPLRGRCSHNAAFCKIAPFATLRFAPWGDRSGFAYAPFGFTE